MQAHRGDWKFFVFTVFTCIGDYNNDIDDWWWKEKFRNEREMGGECWRRVIPIALILNSIREGEIIIIIFRYV